MCSIVFLHVLVSQFFHCISRHGFLDLHILVVYKDTITLKSHTKLNRHPRYTCCIPTLCKNPASAIWCWNLTSKSFSDFSWILFSVIPSHLEIILGSAGFFHTFYFVDMALCIVRRRNLTDFSHSLYPTDFSAVISGYTIQGHWCFLSDMKIIESDSSVVFGLSLWV